MKRRTLMLAVGLTLLAGLIWAEPAFKSLSCSQTVASETFAHFTKTVTIVSDGASTCYFRLFTDVDTAADATTGSAPFPSGAVLTFTLYPQTLTGGATERDSESIVAGRRASQYKTLSCICGTGLTATWRVYSK